MSIPTGATEVTYSFPIEKELEPGLWDFRDDGGTFIFSLSPITDAGSSVDVTPQERSDMAEAAMDSYLSNLTEAVSGASDYRVSASRSYTMPNQTGDTWPTV